MHQVGKISQEAGRHEDLLQTLDREIERTSDTGSVVALMHKAAEICETKLDNVDEAVTRYKEILLRKDRPFNPHFPTRAMVSSAALGREVSLLC